MPELPALCKSLEDLTDSLSIFISSPLVCQIAGGIHVNDALIYDAWGALPSEWTTYWDSLPDHRTAQQHLIDSIDEDIHASSRASDHLSLPPSLVEWLKKLKSVSLPRIQRPGPILALPEALTSHMKTKKINEVSIAAAHIYEVCQANDITHIIDMGSGQGYLSVSLAFLFPSLRVLAIDGSESQIAGSKEFAASLDISEDRLTHNLRYIDGSSTLAAEMNTWANGKPCLLVGLHACGRLSEYMMAYFTMCPFITQLAAVGCCYNHIIPRSESCPEGFPISQKLRMRDVTLSPTALMTGCQAPNNWERPNLTTAASIYSKKQFYRAVLEKLFHDKGVNVHRKRTETVIPEKMGEGNDQSKRSDRPTEDNPENRPNWGIRKGDLISFEKFTRRAMHCLGVDQDQISTQDIRQYEEQFKTHEGKIAILWTLSVLCCKAVESIIALDRYWFLVERGVSNVDIVPIFDYKVSPRNLMILAQRELKST